MLAQPGSARRIGSPRYRLGAGGVRFLYLTRLISVGIMIVLFAIWIALGIIRARRRSAVASVDLRLRVAAAVAVAALGAFWATRPGMPGVLRWGYVRYWVGDAGTGRGLGDLVCEDLHGATGRRGPLRLIGYVGPIGAGIDPRAQVVHGGWFHGAPSTNL
jgi:hypothetical protein